MERVGARAAFLLMALALCSGACSSPEEKPKDLKLLRKYLLKEAERDFKHALRITQRHSPDPFNQAREQLVLTLLELEEFDRAKAMGLEFISQENGYAEAARTKLAGIELDWKKALAGDPSMHGTSRENVYTDGIRDWKGRIEVSERRILDISLVLGEAAFRRDMLKEAIGMFKSMLEIKPDHNTALRRIGQAYAMLGEHELGATYLEKAYAAIEARVRDLKEEMADGGLGAGEGEEGPGEGTVLGKEAPAGEEAGGSDPTALDPNPPRPDSADSAALGQQVQRLERAMVELAAVLGTLHFLAGSLQASEEWFSRAFALDPTSPSVELKLGLALIAEGRLPAAAGNIGRFRKSLSASSAHFFGVLLDRIEKKHGLSRK